MKTDLFKSKDSQFFLKLAFKAVMVPFICSLISLSFIYSLFTMNYQFFSSQSFTADFGTFVDRINFHTHDLAIYGLIFFIGVFFAGLILSYMSVKPFNYMESFALDFFEDSTLKFKQSSSHFLLARTAKIFFEYLGHICQKGYPQSIDVPYPLIKLKGPKHDKTFIAQFFIMAFIIILSFYQIQAEILNQIYAGLLKEALNLSTSQFLISNFIVPQKQHIIHFQIFNSLLCFLGYIVLYFNISTRINGVSYGFIRDMLQLIKGDHSARLKPRFSDPGQEMSETLNELIDEVVEQINDEESINSSLERISQDFKPEFQSLNDLNLSPKEINENDSTHSSMEVNSPVIKMMIGVTSEEQEALNKKKKSK